MGRIHNFLGLSVGLIVPGRNASPGEKRAQYACDITYGTNNEFGFDYLRDNMVTKPANSPSGATSTPSSTRSTRSSSTRPARRSSSPAASPTPPSSTTASPRSCGACSATTTTRSTRRSASSPSLESGIEKVEHALGVENLYDGVAQNLVHQLQAALKAKELYRTDKDYVVANGEVKIVDEFTGRILEGRRWSEGLHQAVEAKEGVKIKEENQTLATITLQNYFRLYEKLAGMTGTATTEAAEFANTYGLQAVPIPTNKPPTSGSTSPT